MSKFSKLFKDIFSAKYSCAICQREISKGEILCDSCKVDMPLIGENSCYICGRYVTSDAKVCEACVGKPKNFDNGKVIFVYKDKIKHMVWRFKFNHALDLLNFLIPLSKDKIKEFNEQIDFVTFVPMRRYAHLVRGYNQSEMFAKSVSQNCQIAFFGEIEKVRNTKKQKTLNFATRKKNLKGAFNVFGDVKGKTVLVVDDVLTTGATLDEIAIALKKKGAKRVLTLCICATDLKTQRKNQSKA